MLQALWKGTFISTATTANKHYIKDIQRTQH